MLNILDNTPDHTVNPVEQFLRSDRMPHIWCPGCGIGTTVNFLRPRADRIED
jgi:2-oxoglutarate ferredoxin oxidoreductase subunit beta